jgi:hypothetical protein
LEILILPSLKSLIIESSLAMSCAIKPVSICTILIWFPIHFVSLTLVVNKIIITWFYYKVQYKMKEAGHADWSTRNQLQITGQDRLLTKGLIRASLFAQYRMSILLCSFNPNFPKTILLCLFPKSSYPAVTVSLSGVVSPWDTLMLQGLVSPLVLLYHGSAKFVGKLLKL